jgi:serine protease SohB
VNELAADYLLFLAKTVTAVVAFVLALAGTLAVLQAARRGRPGASVQIEHMNQHYREQADQLREAVLDAPALKALRKRRRKEEKATRKQADGARARVFVLGFKGDLQASAVDNLREEITTLLQVAGPQDEVVLKLESEGGMVHGYGLAASQLTRVKARGLPLTVAVDKVAASGGYMMACVADRIIAAPFAILGSIGVVAQLPNFHRWLQRHDVDFELHTAGEYKRTLTLFGENSDAARAKFREELEETHHLFQRFVAENRPQLTIAEVATGEHWFGLQALERKLVDEIRTSDDYLLARSEQAELYSLRYHRPRKLAERLSRGLARLGIGLRDGFDSAASRRWT